MTTIAEFLTLAAFVWFCLGGPLFVILATITGVAP